MRTRLETRRVASRRRKDAGGERTGLSQLHPHDFRPLEKQDIPLVFITHNDLKFMRSLLQHYRKLGVTRFICVDDRSTDGTREFLCEQPDVDVWSADTRFKEAKRGRLWREALFARYGKQRWYVSIDSDEYLVYEQCYDKPLAELISHLESRDIRRFAAPMIDMYPGGSVDASRFDGNDAMMPWEVADCFDGEGYVIEKTKRFLSLFGGPRRRKFASELELMKYPLMFWDETCSTGVSIHQPLPFERNFYPISAVLLHFKFFADYREKTKDAVADQQYFGDAREYRRILAAIEKTGDLDFVYEGTVKYSSPQQLIERGFMHSIW
ncbi:hypothetical protein ADU59_22845 [Pararhizobium polonicum]|uniref:Glycosyl transferase family 2 n=1 Tax=Pararhizobium polonicum TaxID=1612624 RepID=A0A1C7NWI4_9HYPH|nr:glycosyltransferase family 2 protein [Pararhizobium polonicum]OBZ93359.1 hypothetical protein ADU59_22845 [Pararhizobium polonicum]